MSYTGTVTCSYCYNRGHNRSTCPKERDDIAARREDYGATDWRVADYDQRMERKKQRSSGANRRCSYCSEQGHNRRSCSLKKEHVDAFARQNADFRRKVKEHLVEVGVGPGAIIEGRSWNTREGTYEDVPLLLTSISWDEIYYHRRGAGDVIDVRHMQNLSHIIRDFTRLPIELDFLPRGGNLKILSQSRNPLKNVPPSWETSRKGMADLFKRKAIFDDRTDFEYYSRLDDAYKKSDWTW